MMNRLKSDSSGAFGLFSRQTFVPHILSTLQFKNLLIQFVAIRLVTYHNFQINEVRLQT